MMFFSKRNIGAHYCQLPVPVAYIRLVQCGYCGKYYHGCKRNVHSSPFRYSSEWRRIPKFRAKKLAQRKGLKITVID